MKIYINGRFLTQKLMGVQRFATEILYAMVNNCSDDDEFIILVPKEHNKLDFESDKIKYQVIGKSKGYIWEQITLPRYLKKHKVFCINMCNMAPRKRTGFVVIHDLNYLEHKEFYSKKMWISQKIINSEVKHAKKIFVVSNFTKEQVDRHYKKHADVVVIGSGHEHILRKHMIEDKDYLSTFSFADSKFFLYVGRLTQNKNLPFVLANAKKHPEFNFVFVGQGDITQFTNGEKLDNVFVTGYLEDDELLYLYSKCYAYIFPTLAEGFGLPPLEAIAGGCKSIIVSDIPVLKEIYGTEPNVATFIDPLNPNSFDKAISNLKVISTDEKERLLNKYSWVKYAKTILDLYKANL